MIAAAHASRSTRRRCDMLFRDASLRDALLPYVARISLDRTHRGTPRLTVNRRSRRRSPAPHLEG